MPKGITPKIGYAFQRKETGNLSLKLFLGTGDSLDNYEEISKAEYDAITEAERIKSEEGAP